MSVGTNNSLIGLSLLSGTALPGLAGSLVVESRAVRAAKAQFTLAPVTPPWKQAASSLPESAQVSAIKRMATIIDDVGGQPSLPSDVQTAFTTYKALDRLRMLAACAARGGTSLAGKDALQEAFSKGLSDLQRFLAAAPADRLILSLGAPARRVDSVTVQAAEPTEWSGTVVASTRTAPLAGLSGHETFELSLGRNGVQDRLVVDLSTGTQPPTLDSVAAMLNSAIASIPLRDANGTIVLDGSGNPRPKWATSFAVIKSDTGWGLQLRTMGVEEVSLRDLNARDNLMIAATQAATGQQNIVALSRFDVPQSALTRAAVGTLTAVDGQATAAVRLLPNSAPTRPAKDAPVELPAPMSAASMVTDADGFTYVVGTTAGDVAGQLGDGADDLVLTKLDGRGATIWQRNLGTGGKAAGVAVQLAPGGGVVVAGTATGQFDGINTDGDMLIARFDDDGGELFARTVRSVGADVASVLAVARDGSIVIGGQDAGGGATLARLDASGRLLERASLGSGLREGVRSLAVEPSGDLLVLTQAAGGTTLRRLGAGSLNMEVGRIDLGAVDAKAMAVSDDGTIAVGGSQTGTTRDGWVAMIDPTFTFTRPVTLASGGSDQIDSLGFLGGKLFAGGRTTGDLGGVRSGAIDGFAARLDPAGGAIESIVQWGRSGVSVGNVQVASAPTSVGATTALGFRNGLLNPAIDLSLVAQTSLRAGDSFAFSVDGGATRKLTMTAKDTLRTLTDRMAALDKTGALRVSAVKQGGGYALRIEATGGHRVQLRSGPEGSDVLAKLGLGPGSLIGAAVIDPKAPRVQPGGSYGLELSTALNLKDPASAKLALAKVQSAISTTQSAFRSLYWDENKAALVNGGRGGSVSKYQSAQLGRYQDALARLGGF